MREFLLEVIIAFLIVAILKLSVWYLVTPRK